MTATRRTLLVGVVLLLASAAVVVPNFSDLWEFLTVRRIYIDELSDGHRVLGYYSVSRWSGDRHGRTLTHFADTGLRSVDAVWSDGLVERSTAWSHDGTVREQIRDNSLPDRRLPLEGRDRSPWWWNEKDESVPSAPWVELGITPEEWWGPVRPE